MRKFFVYSLAIGVLFCSAISCATAPAFDTTLAPTATDRSIPSSAPSAAFTPAPVDIPGTTIIYYDISGSTESELRAQLDALGPVGYDGYKGDSTTKWYIQWNWPGYRTNTCDLSAAAVSYDIQVIFPRWAPPENADPGLVAKWADYTRALAEHEKGHADFVVANYRSVTEAILAASCQTAEHAAQTALAAIRQHDLDYDAETNHGATQGARFP